MSPVPLTGVNPVPPSISESKLKGMPAEGVVIGTPATSSTVVGPGFDGKEENLRELGLEGLFPSEVARSAMRGFFGGLGWEDGAITEFSFWIITLFSSSIKITGFMSIGEGGLSVPASRQQAL